MGNDCCAQARDNKGLKKEVTQSKTQILLESAQKQIDIIDLNKEETRQGRLSRNQRMSIIVNENRDARTIDHNPLTEDTSSQKLSHVRSSSDPKELKIHYSAQIRNSMPAEKTNCKTTRGGDRVRYNGYFKKINVDTKLGSDKDSMPNKNLVGTPLSVIDPKNMNDYVDN